MLATIDAQAPAKRSVTVAGHKTSISLEAAFWEALKEQATAKQAQSAALLARASAETASSVEHTVEAVSDDKLNALAGIKFEQTLPVLKDYDPDFERHWHSALQQGWIDGTALPAALPAALCVVLRVALQTAVPAAAAPRSSYLD